MNVEKNSSEVLIFGFPENLRLELFKILSKFSWTYVCSNSLRDYERIDNLYDYKIALFYLSDNSYETFSFISSYIARELTTLKCPKIAITTSKELTFSNINKSIFEHLFHQENLEGSISHLIRYYYLKIPKEIRYPNVNYNTLAVTNCQIQWINSISFEAQTNFTFFQLTPISLEGEGADYFNLKNCRLIAYPEKNHKDGLLKIRVDGVSSTAISKIKNLDQEIKDTSIKVLSLDDDPEFCLLLKRRMEKSSDFKFSFATNIDMFFKKIEKEKYDLYLIDYNLGQKFKGLEVVKFLREQFGSSVLIFMLSKSDLKEELPNSFDYGFNDYFFKPINMEQILGKLNYFLPLERKEIPLKQVPTLLQHNTISIKAEILSFNTYTCLIKTPFSANINEEFLLFDFLSNEFEVKVRVKKEVDRGSSYAILNVEYINPRHKLIDYIRQSKMFTNEDENEN